MIKKPIVILLILFFFSLTILGLLFLYYSQNTVDKNLPNDGRVNEEIDVKNTEQNARLNRLLNQKSKDIPDGYSSVDEFFVEKNNLYKDDCLPLEVTISEDPTEEATYIKSLEIMNYFSILPSDPENDFFKSKVIRLDDGKYCVFIDLERDNKKTIFYINQSEEFIKVDL